MNIAEKVWQEYYSKLLRFIAKRVDNQATAEDILQDILLKIYTKEDTLKNNAKLESWLYQITKNAIIDYYRSRKQHVALSSTLESDLSHSAPDTDYADASISEELSACLQPMIEQLPAHYRDALILSELQGKTQQEVADSLNISLSGAKSRIQRGRNLVKGLLFECCRFEFDKAGRPIEYSKKDQHCDSC